MGFELNVLCAFARTRPAPPPYRIEGEGEISKVFVSLQTSTVKVRSDIRFVFLKDSFMRLRMYKIIYVE